MTALLLLATPLIIRLHIVGLLVNADIVSVSSCDPVMMSFDKGNLVSLSPRCVWSRIEM